MVVVVVLLVPPHGLVVVPLALRYFGYLLPHPLLVVPLLRCLASLLSPRHSLLPLARPLVWSLVLLTVSLLALHFRSLPWLLPVLLDVLLPVLFSPFFSPLFPIDLLPTQM